MNRNQYQDKFQLTKALNYRLIKSNLTKLVHTNARFEGVTTTLPQTQTIIDGLGVNNVSITDIETITNLKRGWQYLLTKQQHNSTTLAFAQQINKLVAQNDSLAPGQLRTGNSQVNLGLKTYQPPIITRQQESAFFQRVLNDANLTTTNKALTIMYHIMRQQIFWDGNKRTATLVANKIMANGGAGIINIPLVKWNEYNHLISDFYLDNNSDKIKQWTYDHAIQGIS